MNQIWSWVLTAVGITGFILAGKKIWWSWYINIGCQALWFTYAIVTDQYGFIAAAIAYTIVFIRNARQWTKEHHRRQAQYSSFYPNAEAERRLQAAFNQARKQTDEHFNKTEEI